MTKRREFLLLADTYKESKGHDPIGMFMSEKLDGARCFWDGGVSRGDRTVNVPWANIYDPKQPDILKAKIKPVATGLWSRYGNPIQAPEWFLDKLPAEPLDGELYMGRGKFSDTMSVTRKDVPIDEEWERVRYVAFGAPTTTSVFQSGLVKNPQMVRPVDIDACRLYYHSRGYGFGEGERVFIEELDVLEELMVRHPDGPFSVAAQVVCESAEQLDAALKNVKALGGEGVMLRDFNSVWFPKRRPLLLKVKPRHDAECRIVGFFAGEKGKTGHLLGKMGGVHVEWTGDETAPCGKLDEPVRFKIGSGFTYEDRELHGLDALVARDAAGKELHGVSETKRFAIGDVLTFSYMDVSKDNVPREPTFTRKREDL